MCLLGEKAETEWTMRHREIDIKKLIDLLGVWKGTSTRSTGRPPRSEDDANLGQTQRSKIKHINDS